MPIVVDTTETAGEGYATLVDVRAVYDEGTDNQVLAAIAYASALINARARRSFYPVSEQKISGQTSGTIVLNIPGDIDEIEINGSVIDADAYEIDSMGVIRFRAEPGGIYYDTAHPLTTEPIRFNGRPFTVTVRGSFGQVSPLIKEATVLLAIDRLRKLAGESTSIVPNVPVAGPLTSLSDEGLSLSWATSSSSSSSSGRRTTGNAQADNLIDLVSRRPIGVA